MATLQVPADFALELQSALRWCGQSRASVAFYALVSADTTWCPARVRELIRWAERRSVGVTGERFLTCPLCGFRGDERPMHMRQAVAELQYSPGGV